MAYHDGNDKCVKQFVFITLFVTYVNSVLGASIIFTNSPL